MDYVKQFLHVEGIIGQGTYGKVLVTRLLQDHQQQSSPPSSTQLSKQQFSPINDNAQSSSQQIKLLTPDGNQQSMTTSPIRLTPGSNNTSVTTVLPPSPNSSNCNTIISNDSGINNNNSNITKNNNNYQSRGTRFALKCIHPVTKPLRLASELRYLRDLGGKWNVVQLHSAHFHMGSLFIVMDLIMPDRFVDFVAKLDYEEIWLYMENLLLALRHVHAHNVMHRDIKPANFLFNRKQRKFLLVDFGLAQPSRAKSTLFTTTNTAGATPGSTPQFTKTPLDVNKFAGSAKTPNIRQINKGSLTISNTSISMVTSSPRTPISIAKRYPLGSQMFSENHDGRTDQHPLIIPNSPFMNPKQMQSPAKRLNFTPTASPATPNISTKRLINPNETNDSIQMLKKLRVSNIDDTREPVKLTVGAYESPVTHNDISTSRSTRNQDNHKFSTPKIPRRCANARCDCRGKPKTCANCLSRPDAVAPRSGTPGFKAPEVLLRYPYQTTAIDIWSAGVIMICLLSGHSPIFRDTDDTSSLSEIITILGSQRMTLAAKELGLRLIVEPPREPIDLRYICKQIRSTNKDKLQIDISDEAFDLLEKMLDPSPLTRITAEDALKHPWLMRPPTPSKI